MNAINDGLANIRADVLRRCIVDTGDPTRLWTTDDDPEELARAVRARMVAERAIAMTDEEWTGLVAEVNE